MQWYQCDIVTIDGDIDYWTRFIAKDSKTAEERIKEIYKSTLKRSDKAINEVAINKIAAFKIYKIPEIILAHYDLNNSVDVELLHNRVRG